MKPPIEHIRVSAKSKEILIKLKRNTGLEHWNWICKIALCHSLKSPSRPKQRLKSEDSNIDMEWKTFSGHQSNELSSIIYIRAIRDGINIDDKFQLSEYFRDHLERGIDSIRNTKSVEQIAYILTKHNSANK